MTVLDLSSPRRIDLHPPESDLLTLEGLAEAANRLAPEQIEHHLGDALPHLLPDGRIRRLPEAADEVIRTIETNGCWVMLMSLASLPEYRTLLLRLAAPLQLAVRAADEHPVAHDLIGFVGAPHANVPLHFDTNHHLLVQVRGTKTVGVGSFDDPVVERHQIERGMREHRLNADREPDQQERFTLGPGQALLLPAFTFHWVEGGDDVSVAAACLVTTDETRRRADELRASARAG